MTLHKGRVAMGAELDVLRKAVKGKRTYVEIGVLWGGSLIEAALAEPNLRCWGIDPFDGYYGGRDLYDGNEWRVPNIDDVVDNLKAAGVEDRVELVWAYSNPFPLPGMQFDVGLIDGDHSIEAVKQDWESLSKCCAVVLLHDADDPAIAEFLTTLEGYTVTLYGRMAMVE